MGSKVKVTGKTDFNLAASNEKYSRILCIRELLCNKADVDTVDVEGRSPIYNAINSLMGYELLLSLERLTRVGVLILSGSPPNTLDNAESTPANICEERGYTNIREILFKTPDELIQSISRTMERISRYQTITTPFMRNDCMFGAGQAHKQSHSEIINTVIAFLGTITFDEYENEDEFASDSVS